MNPPPLIYGAFTSNIRIASRLPVPADTRDSLLSSKACGISRLLGPAAMPFTFNDRSLKSEEISLQPLAELVGLGFGLTYDVDAP